MPPEPGDPYRPADILWGRLAAGLWACVLVGICVRSSLQPRTHSIYPTYAAAGAHWRAGTSVYHWSDSEPGVEPYRYSPLVAAWLVPFELLPAAAGGSAWRLLNAGVLLAGLAAWLRSPLPWRPDARQRALVYLLVLPLALASLNNGQANPLMVGLLLGAVAAAGAGRWNAAAGCTALATAVKVYPLALGLLLAAAYPRRFTARLLAALVAVAALPFLFQRPAYVAGQYAEWLGVLAGDDRRFWPIHVAYRDLWLLVRVTGAPVGPGAYRAVQLFSAAACAAVCVAGRWRGWGPDRVLTAALTLGTCWMTLCGPATESSTYVLLAPALAWGLLAARAEGWPRPVRWLPGAAAGLLLAGILAGLSRRTAEIHALGVQPLGALLLFAAYLATHLRALRAGSARADAGPGGPVARAA